MERNLLLKLWFSEVFGPCNPKAFEFLKRYSFIEDIYDNRLSAALAKDLSPTELSKMHKLTLDDMKKRLSICEEQNIKILFYSDFEYPERLRMFDIPPISLFVTGNVEALNGRLIAGVGSRKPTRYGKDVVEYIMNPLLENDFCLVSGLADGIDSEVHKIAVRSKGKTVAVLGCGIDGTYPKFNQQLRKQIEIDGASVSEYPPKAGCSPYMFPIRNRIIAGLSMGVIIFEAAKKSGTMITANYALNNSREVFAVPGSVFSKQSEGTNHLISLGAVPICSNHDVFDTFNIEYKPKSDKSIPQKKQIKLSDTEQKIMEVLQQGQLRPDEMFEKLSVPMFEILASLSNLEMEDVVDVLPGQKYSLKNMYE